MNPDKKGCQQVCVDEGMEMEENKTNRALTLTWLLFFGFSSSFALFFLKKATHNLPINVK